MEIDTGEVWAVPDGTVLMAQEPLVEVTAPMPVAQLLETAMMNVVQYPAMIATKAARCQLAADGRRLADFGFRRAHGLETGVEAALAAHTWVAGSRPATSRPGATTASRRPGRRRTRTCRPSVTSAIEVCHELDMEPRGVRLDSGDLGALSVEARRMLDEAGFETSIVIVSGGLDEYEIHDLVTWEPRSTGSGSGRH